LNTRTVFLKKVVLAGEQTRDLLILFIFSFNHFTTRVARWYIFKPKIQINIGPLLSINCWIVGSFNVYLSYPFSSIHNLYPISSMQLVSFRVTRYICQNVAKMWPNPFFDKIITLLLYFSKKLTKEKNRPIGKKSTNWQKIDQSGHPDEFALIRHTARP
jgi:hypothetical protein